MNKEITETIEILKELSPLLVEATEWVAVTVGAFRKALSTAISWGEALEQAEGELGKKQKERTCLETNNDYEYGWDNGYNKMHSIARPILAKAKLELKGLRTKILEMSYEAIADNKRIEELHNEILELKGVTYD